MTESATTKTKENKAEKQQTLSSEGEITKTLNLRPLPQNRPISTNVPMANSIDALLGYLD